MEVYEVRHERKQEDIRHEEGGKEFEKDLRLSCCVCFEKWVLWSVNFILFIFGATQILLGLYVIASDTTTWIGSFFPNYAVGMGVIVSLITFLGWFGSARQSRCMLWTYTWLLFQIILVQTIGLTVLSISITYTKDFLSYYWRNLSDNDQASVEDSYKCCSFDGNNTDATQRDKDRYDVCMDEYPLRTETCWEKEHNDIESNIWSIYIASVIVLCLQVLLLFMTLALINGITAHEIYKRLSIVMGM